MGTITKRGNALYLRYNKDGKDVRKSTGLKDTKENRKYLEKEVIPQVLKLLQIGGVEQPKANRTIRYYADKHLRYSEKCKSYTSIQGYVEKVVSYFGANRDVADITRLDIKDFLDDLDMKDVSKKNYLAALNGILDVAVDGEYLETNKAQNISFRNDGEEINPFTAEEVQTILSRATGTFKDMLGVLFTMGLRPSELLGLMLPNVGKEYIVIKEAIVRGHKGDTKTKSSKRKIPIRDEARPFIDGLLSIPGRKSLYLVVNNQGEPYWDICSVRKKWKALLEECGIAHRKLYTTRHTFISHMLLSGVRAPIIAEYVGHNDVRLIQSVYGHYIDGELVKLDSTHKLYAVGSGTLSGTPNILTDGGSARKSDTIVVECRGIEPLTSTLPAYEESPKVG